MERSRLSPTAPFGRAAALLLAALVGVPGCQQQRMAPVVAAIEGGDLGRVKELVAKDPSLVNGQVLSGSSRASGPSRIVDRPLTLAATRGQVAIVTLLLDLGAPVNETVIRSETALHRAARWAHLPVMEALLARGANLEARTSEGATPLHYAAQCGCAYGRHVALLVERGAQKDARAQGGKTPLHWAAEEDADDAGLALCAYGADLDAVDAQGRSAKDLAKGARWGKMTKLLGEGGRCRALAALYRERGQPAKAELQASCLEVACEAGSGGACQRAGVLHRDGTEVAKDEPRAVRYFSLACDTGDATGCSLLGLMVQAGSGTEKDEARALGLFRKACDGGSAGGCNNLGVAYRDGEGVAPDLPRARSLFEMACKAGSTFGCTNLGKMLRDGIGGPRDEAHAAELLGAREGAGRAGP